MRLFEKLFWGQSACIEVKVSGQLGKSHYVVFEDGAVVIETPQRIHRFKNLQELTSQEKPLVRAANRPFLRLV